MKRQLFLLTLLSALITTSMAQAQDTTQTPSGQRQGGARGAGGGQRQGGAPQQENQAREAYQDALIGNRAVSLTTVNTLTFTSPWWNNANMVARLGLTDVQKSRIESTFEAHRQSLASKKDQLEKEEAQLSRLLDTESIDRGAVFTQINRVIQARGEMERANATMTLEMREQLTRAQWTQLQASPSWNLRMLVNTLDGAPLLAVPTTPGERGARGGGGRGPAPQQ